MPLDQHNSISITAKATGLSFNCLMLLQPERCLLAYRSMSNAFFRDLPVSSFEFHSSFLAVKSINLVVACDGFFCVTEIICIFHSGYFNCRVLFKQFLIRTAV